MCVLTAVKVSASATAVSASCDAKSSCISSSESHQSSAVPSNGSSPSSSWYSSIATLIRYPFRFLKRSVSGAWPSTQRLVNSSRLRPGLALRSAISLTGFDISLLSSLDRSERQAADDVALEHEREHDHRQDRDRRQRADLTPQDLVPADEVGERDGQRPNVRARQEEREQELVPREDEREQGARHHPRQGQPQRDPGERLPAARPVDERRLLEIARQVIEETLHEPDDERDVERQVGDDQRPIRVQQLPVAKEQEQRDRGRHRREHPDAEDPEGKVLTADTEAAEAVRGRDPDEQRKERVRGSNDQAVLQRLAARAAERRRVMAEVDLLRQEDRRIGEDLALRLERRQHDPDHRQQEEREGREHDQPRRRSLDYAAPAHPSPFR